MGPNNYNVSSTLCVFYSNKQGDIKTPQKTGTYVSTLYTVQYVYTVPRVVTDMLISQNLRI
jgi:hypothetical protein